ITGVLAVSTTPAPSTARAPTRTPSTTTHRDPMNAPSSITTGAAWTGSRTPPLPTPPARRTARPICPPGPPGPPRPTPGPGPPPDPNATGKVHVTADLRARPDGRPRVDHGAGADPRADVHVARHEHRTRLDVRPVPNGGGRHDTDAVVGEAALQRHLVVVLERPDVGRLEPPHTEVQQHRLLDPRVYAPRPRTVGLGDAQLTAVQAVDRGLDRLDVERGAGVVFGGRPCGLDALLEVSDHADTSAKIRSSAVAARRHSASVGTIAMRTNPSPSGPKNEPGATTTPARSRRSSAQSSDVRPTGTATQR